MEGQDICCNNSAAGFKKMPIMTARHPEWTVLFWSSAVRFSAKCGTVWELGSCVMHVSSGINTRFLKQQCTAEIFGNFANQGSRQCTAEQKWESLRLKTPRTPRSLQMGDASSPFSEKLRLASRKEHKCFPFTACIQLSRVGIWDVKLQFRMSQQTQHATF